MEPRRRTDINLAILPAAHAAKPLPNVLFCIPLDSISVAERNHELGQHRISTLAHGEDISVAEAILLLDRKMPMNFENTFQ